MQSRDPRIDWDEELRTESRPISEAVRRAHEAAPLDLDPLRKTLRKSTGDEDSVVPSLQLSLTLSGDPFEVGESVRSALAIHAQMIAPEVLRSAVVGDDVVRLTERRRALDERALLTARTAPLRLEYTSTEFGAPGDHGVYVHLAARATDPSFIRFAFPWNAAEGASTASFIAQALTLAACLPVASGTLGFGFTYSHFDRLARDHVHTHLARHLGFHHSVAAPSPLGRAPCPSWLTFLGPHVVAPDLEAALRTLAHVPRLDAGTALVLRAAELPPVGAVETGARDLGFLPDIARAFAPFREPLPPFGGSRVTTEASTWAARLDQLASGVFEGNR